MEIFSIKNLTFTYPKGNIPVLNDLTFSIKQGQFVTLCGSSGCGKTTLLRQLKPSLTPHGIKSGEILFENKPFNSLDLRDQNQLRWHSQKIGFVLQSPENQIVTDKVWHELAFGLESLGIDTPTIRRRVAEMASFFGIQTWFYKNVTELSGGQKQLLNLASIMAMQPSVLILDEPTGQLDPIAAAEFLDIVGKINRELGVTVILTEHRLEEVFPHSDRVIVMDKGGIIADGTAREIGHSLKERGHGMFAAMPIPMRVYAATPSDEECPVTVREGKDWLEKQTIVNKNISENSYTVPKLSPAVEFNDVWFKYEKGLPDVLKGLSFSAYPGEICAVLGGNGTGKTTALSLVSGLNKPYRGTVKLDGNEIDKVPANKLFNGFLGVLPQNPQSVFVKKTVEEDLLEMLDEVKLSKGNKLPYEEKKARVAAVAELCGIERLMQSHPYDISGGEQQRAALAKVLLLKPKILLLDEPTKGLDAEFKQEFAGMLREMANQGVCVVIVSHDIEFCAEHADRCALFFDGNIVSEGEPHSFFSGNSFYTTAANRMARQILPEAVTANDVIHAIGGKPFEPAQNGGGAKEVDENKTEYVHDKKNIQNKSVDKSLSSQLKKSKYKLSKRTLAAFIMILLAIPLTICFGIYFLGDRKYYFISMLIIIETLLPFALVFESRKAQARELIVIAVLCAIAVAGRAAFFMLPQFKPVVALVIIAGVAFGGETGFLVGAIAAFVSNMFFGQGPWTPWQMFAFGIIGFLAGICFRKGILARSRVALCTFGFLTALFIYGGIMNPASVLIYQQRPVKEMFYFAYLQGLPFDLVHAIATVIFLTFTAKPMLEKLDRIKVKYGLIE